jgi:hypothetical protein
MSYSGVQNESPFAVQELLLAEEDGRDVIAVVVKATYAVVESAVGRMSLTLLQTQPPIEVAGSYYGEPGTSSPRLAPETALIKLATDVVLLGHAYPEHVGDRQVDVGLRVGPILKTIRVFGDRYWTSIMGFAAKTDPAPFIRIPLQYEYAFGGWDRRHENPDKHRVESRNPVGVGFRQGWWDRVEEGSRLPNLERPGDLIRDPADHPEPIGYGFLGVNWEPRVRLAGTYDDAWQKARQPLLPLDFDRRFYNAAPQDQIVNGYLRGDESVYLQNVTPGGELAFSLPGEPPPSVTVRLRNEDTNLTMRLDTLVIDTDVPKTGEREAIADVRAHVSLTWRGHVQTPGGPHSLRAIEVCPHPASKHARAEATAVAMS